MTIEAIGAIAPLGTDLPIRSDAALASSAAAPDFGKWFAQQVGNVNDSIVTADEDVRRLAAGEVQSLHEVMMHMEEARLSLQLLAQVRNRLLDAYQEVMRMQV